MNKLSLSEAAKQAAHKCKRQEGKTEAKKAAQFAKLARKYFHKRFKMKPDLVEPKTCNSAAVYANGLHFEAHLIRISYPKFLSEYSGFHYLAGFSLVTTEHGLLEVSNLTELGHVLKLIEEKDCKQLHKYKRSPGKVTLING